MKTILPFQPLFQITLDNQSLEQTQQHLEDAVYAHDTHYDPFDCIYKTEFNRECQNNYSDPWTMKVRSDTGISKASGYSAEFLYSRTISSAFSNLFHVVATNNHIPTEKTQ